jgi:hypothetical protein
MDPRNKRALLILAGFGGVFIIALLILGVGGGGGRDSDLKRIQKQQEGFYKDLAEYQKIAARVNAIDAKIDKTPSDYDLFGALGKIEEELGIKSNVRNQTNNSASSTDFYSEASVTMDLQKITLDQLVSLMSKIEDINTAGEAFVRISQLTVSRSFKEEDRILDVTIKVAYYSRPTATGTPP